ncbi:MAG: glycosyltransferase [Vicinamibacteria bacterium]|nr:glycosyltransferase [Vicinamibacteria bacterium]
MTRVALLVNDLNGTGGAERQVFELASGLDRARFEPLVVLLKERNDYAEALAQAGVAVHALRRRGAADLGCLARLAALLRAQRPALVHSFLFLSNLHAALVARAAGVGTVVVSQRTSYEHNLPVALPALWRRLARASYRRVDRVAFNSRAALEEEVAAGLPRERARLIFNGLAEDDVDARAAAPALRREAGGGPLAVAVGRLEAVKGHAHLLEAWAAARAALPSDARLVLVGDGAERECLRQRMRALDLERGVTLVGPGPGRAWIAAADLLVQPSLAEGLSNAVLEAMAESRPVIATAVGGTPDAVVDGETGWLVPAADPGALATALAQALGTPAERERRGLAGRRRFESLFTRQAMTRASERLYDELLAGRRS